MFSLGWWGIPNEIKALRLSKGYPPQLRNPISIWLVSEEGADTHTSLLELLI